jgi:(4-(4-[2-(gamma-L-glutamylamino)ethyl]phenoxymethyl)furan-2-yl)methanamine synthase
MSTWGRAVSSDAWVIGWDLGGAHLKAAVYRPDGGLDRVVQRATPLWRGLEHLDAALAGLRDELPLAEAQHCLTLTGELVDLFPSRADGVATLVRRFASLLPPATLSVYAGRAGFLPAEAAVFRAADVASANWHASAGWLAGVVDTGLFVDIGSTTTDIVLCRGGAVAHLGYCDRTRLAAGELVYTGVVRTPVMAVADRVPFAGDWQGLANELFACMADVYRVLGWLPDEADLHPTLDGQGKGRRDSMRRLARMLGADLDTAGETDWQRLAAFLAGRQQDTLVMACARQLSRAGDGPVTLVGAGVGRFLAQRLATALSLAYIDIGDLIGPADGGGLDPAVCAPAVAVARLGMARA